MSDSSSSSESGAESSSDDDEEKYPEVGMEGPVLMDVPLGRSANHSVITNKTTERGVTRGLFNKAQLEQHQNLLQQI